MIDLNAGCGNWPFRPIRANTAAGLRELLQAEGVQKACAYPLESYFWPDCQEANELRLPELAKDDFFVPSAVLNPTLPNGLSSYEICRNEWGVPLVRLLPSYHLYDLSHQGIEPLVERAEEDGVILGVHILAEDKRNRNPILIEPPEVPFVDIVDLARRHPNLQVVAYCWARIGAVGSVVPNGHIRDLAQIEELEPRADVPDNLHVDLSFFEFEDTFSSALKIFRADRLILGTHAPLHYPKAAILKIQNSAAPEEAKTAALAGNARRLLGLA
ncbi:MAG: amidohydrolase family protein [Candidatus Latescibacteria bacterium]|jgi:predicted TIM-barrel fold metal-dependent hydrolase|nr:amidohydrolase family protein [Candidatus Latescibacterota bacterium]